MFIVVLDIFQLKGLDVAAFYELTSCGFSAKRYSFLA